MVPICGLAGFFCWGTERPEVWKVQSLLQLQQQRGPDAAGVAYLHKKKGLVITKQAGKPEDFIKAVSDDQWRDIATAPYAVLHARQVSIKIAPASNNDNNHPVSGFGWAVAHNGTLNNDTDLYSAYGDKRFADVDTAAIPLVLSKGKDYKDSLRQLSTLAGSGTMVVVSEKEPEKIAFYRFGKWALYFFYDPAKQILFWSSFPTARIIVGTGPSLGRLRFSNMLPLGDDQLLVLSPSSPETEVYKLERASFFRPSPGLIPSPPQTSGAINAEVGPRLTYFHERHASALGKSKPPVQFDDFQGLMGGPLTTGGWSKEKLRYMMRSQKLMYFKIQSAYGHITAMAKETELSDFGLRASQVVVCSFKPRKGQKKFFHRVGGSLGLFSISLPADEALQKVLDDKLPLETFIIKEKRAHSSYETQRGMLMCPWCGTWDFTYAWSGVHYRCEFCRVKSFVFKEV